MFRSGLKCQCVGFCRKYSLRSSFHYVMDVARACLCRHYYYVDGVSGLCTGCLHFRVKSFFGGGGQSSKVRGGVKKAGGFS